jgi:uncharacterized protein (DUF2235 family)
MATPKRTQPKKIVICCDGTGNSFDNINDDSNVAKLYTSLVINSEQIGYYHPGVGTMGDPSTRGRIARKWSRIKGLAFGRGLLANVADAYRYLMDNYVDGDEVFLFGFSRGAFTARALASVIHVYGLLCPGNHEAIPFIMEMYAKRSRQAKHQEIQFDEDQAFKWQFSRTNDVRIHFCGLWETVSSYGWIYDPIELPFVGTNPIIDIGRQAVSIDERRCFYQDNLWGPAVGKQDIRQVWFSGVHSDVGGSYPEQESALSKIPLEWMFVEAAKAGLAIDIRKAETVLALANDFPQVQGLPNYVKADKNGCLHKSLKRLWWILEFLTQRDPHRNGRGWNLPLGRRRTIPAGSLIHQSVLESKWCPLNLPPYEVEPRSKFRTETPSSKIRLTDEVSV